MAPAAVPLTDVNGIEADDEALRAPDAPAPSQLLAEVSGVKARDPVAGVNELDQRVVGALGQAHWQPLVVK